MVISLIHKLPVNHDFLYTLYEENHRVEGTKIYQTEFRSQEPEFRMNSVRVVDE
ncbi:hypothetical protein [Nostoc sp. 2RC]|uniref:hypothetical protein n=1 Tax=Nostoc sp. 2RC TaxID=2485484 RepID=UPI0016232145|nr:hypothetical protein [Nostoc sp. 2RC]MBC1239832.1 hypothetical protein [Nostoc sp. 2RC]